MENKNEQIVEVEFDSTLVETYKNNYIMEEEGIGAEQGEPFDQQTEFNEDTIEDLIDLDQVRITSIVEMEGAE